MPNLAEEVRRLQQEVDRTQQAYDTEDARGIPMSVRERYEHQLSVLAGRLHDLEEQLERRLGLPVS